MCGIAGVYYKKNINRIQKEKFKNFVQEFQYNRGPDDFNEKQINDRLFFFHNRLSIIDVEHAVQPMEDANGVLAFNGEIYNYQSLRYKDESYVYQSDTEVLLKGFFREGVDFLHQTNSMFGFSFYDKKSSKVTLCRDRMGIKQLYYIDNDEVFAFASTLKPLVIFSQRKLNSGALWGYYLNRAFKAPDTIFEDIKELEAGSILEFDTDKKEIVKKEKWWSRDTLSNTFFDEKEVIETLDKLLHQSIKDRLVADVPVGAFLSGGVDSSIVTAIASEYNSNIEAFTVAMEDKRYDESSYAKAITKKYNLRYHQVVLTGQEFLDDMQKWVSMQDDIVANPSSLMLHKVASLARDNGYKVMLAGEGADEIFAGYASYKRFLLSKETYKYLKFLKPFASPISDLFKADSRKKFFVQNLLSNPAFYGTANIFEPYMIEKMLGYHMEKVETISLKHALDRDIKDRVPNDLLTSNGDRATMGASIEARVPFLAHQIVNFGASIEDSLFTKGGEMKYLLKKLSEKYIPHENIYRKKVGFEMPLADWMRCEFKDTMNELIETSVQRDVLDIEMIKSLFNAHLEHKIDASSKLFAFMSLDLSYRDLNKII
jgi:asparagine synthase (glutamine-hydrolysing)